MSKVQMSTRETHTAYDPEDVRIGLTLQALMHREEINEEGFLVLRKITHSDMAKNIVLNGKRGVHRTYISQLCNGAKHMNNDMLYAIARYLGVNPKAIKRPDMEHATQFAA
ncbi:helix-turn-helix domain-containing protein [Arthrobacter sp. NPDC056886]|uniref:helix-turn-helix domain-containing protein n=1 Tax=Arthrobacter sp. NPDC056886 TaxID=3345960 RepID=UPI003673016F